MGRVITKSLPAKEFLEAILGYEPETGQIFWKERPVSMFCSLGHSREHNCAKWNAKNAGKEAFTALKGDGYRHGTINGNWASAHRVIWKLVTGKEAERIDHENGVRSDNRWKNLRSVPTRINARNMRPSRNKSGQVGVRKNKLRDYWQAYITVDGKFISLGVYKEFSDAVAARKAAEAVHNFHKNHGSPVNRKEA